MAKHAVSIRGAASGIPVSEVVNFSLVMLCDGTIIKPMGIITTSESATGLVLVRERDTVQTEMASEHDLTQGTVNIVVFDSMHTPVFVSYF